MPLRDRAAQFAPFAALTGCEAAVGETARLTAEKRELDAQETEELNRQLAAVIEHLSERPEVTVEYFVPDERKAGGAYMAVTGRVRHVSLPEKVLVMADGKIIISVPRLRAAPHARSGWRAPNSWSWRPPRPRPGCPPRRCTSRREPDTNRRAAGRG